MPQIELYTCDNTKCEFHTEGRRWQVYADVPAVEVVDTYDAYGVLQKRERVEKTVPSKQKRSRCPACGEFGTRVPAGELRDIPTGEAGGYA